MCLKGELGGTSHLIISTRDISSHHLCQGGTLTSGVGGSLASSSTGFYWAHLFHRHGLRVKNISMKFQDMKIHSM